MLSKLESESEVTGIVYPRLLSHIKKHGHNSATIRQVSMLDSEIAEVVEESKCLAQQTMESLGMADLLKKKKCWDYPPIPKLDKLILDEKKDDDNDEKIDQSGKIDSMREVITEEEADQIAKGIVQLKDAGIISNDLNTEIQQLHRSVFKQGSALPIYSTTQTETQSPSGKVCKRKLSPSFVPIIHNGDEKYIHKVTLVWLFQEGERVSSDRLFRVRKTQPHSNDPDAQKTTPTDKIVQQEPIVSSTLQIGDLCIFLDTRTPKRWNFGRVIKFAYYKEKTKKSRQYVSSTVDLTTINHDSIGVLCSWFTFTPTTRTFTPGVSDEIHNYHPASLYTCTLSESCFEHEGTTESQSSSSSILHKNLGKDNKQVCLLTKDIIKITAICLTAIEKLVSDKSISQTSILKQAELSSSSKKVSTKQPHQSSKQPHSLKNKPWLTKGTVGMTKQDRNEILSGKPLTDIPVNKYQQLLKQHFPNIGGLQSTLLQQATSHHSILSVTPPHMHGTANNSCSRRPLGCFKGREQQYRLHLRFILHLIKSRHRSYNCKAITYEG